MKHTSRGFALPTVLISSIIMMMVLLSSLTALSSISVSIRAQYNDKVLIEASESGLSMAKKCIAANSNTITWTNAKPLKPGTDCSGTDINGCSPGSTSNSCYVLNTSTLKSSFEVGIVLDASNEPTDIRAKGVLSETGGASSVIVKVSAVDMKMTTSAPLALLAGVGAKKSLVSLSVGGWGYGSSSVAGQTVTSGTKLCGLTDSGQVWCAGSRDISQYSTNGQYYYFGYGGSNSASTDLGYLGGPSNCYEPNTAATTSCSSSYTTAYGNDLYLTNLSDSATGIFRGKVFTVNGSNSGSNSQNNGKFY